MGVDYYKVNDIDNRIDQVTYEQGLYPAQQGDPTPMDDPYRRFSLDISTEPHSDYQLTMKFADGMELAPYHEYNRIRTVSGDPYILESVKNKGNYFRDIGWKYNSDTYRYSDTMGFGTDVYLTAEGFWGIHLYIDVLTYSRINPDWSEYSGVVKYIDIPYLRWTRSIGPYDEDTHPDCCAFVETGEVNEYYPEYKQVILTLDLGVNNWEWYKTMHRYVEVCSAVDIETTPIMGIRVYSINGNTPHFTYYDPMIPH